MHRIRSLEQKRLHQGLRLFFLHICAFYFAVKNGVTRMIYKQDLVFNEFKCSLVTSCRLVDAFFFLKLFLEDNDTFLSVVKVVPQLTVLLLGDVHRNK